MRLGLETFAQRPRLSSSGRACALADKISSMLLEERVARPVTEREAVQLARDLYGMEVAAKSLPGEYDDNFHLTPVGAGPSGSRDGVSAEQEDAAGFVLKVMHPARERSFIDMQCRALQHLAQRAPQLTLPRVRLTNNGQAFAAIAAPDGSESLVWLLTYVQGTMLVKARPHSPELLQSLGHFLGAMDAALADFSHPAARRELKWDLARAGWIRQHLHLVRDTSRRALVEKFLALYEAEVVAVLPQLRPRGVCRDAHGYNALVGGPSPPPGKDRCVRDFG